MSRKKTFTDISALFKNAQYQNCLLLFMCVTGDKPGQHRVGYCIDTEGEKKKDGLCFQGFTI